LVTSFFCFAILKNKNGTGIVFAFFHIFTCCFRYRYISGIRLIYCDTHTKNFLHAGIVISFWGGYERIFFIPHLIFSTGFRSWSPVLHLFFLKLIFYMIMCGQVKLFALHGPGSAESVYCVCFIFCCIVSTESAHADPGPWKENNFNWPTRIPFLFAVFIVLRVDRYRYRYWYYYAVTVFFLN
jgi:hypothetical protein